VKGDKRELVSIPGSPPNLINPPSGCPFAERCPFETEICSQEATSATEVEPGHYSFCHHVDRIEDMRERAGQGTTWEKEGVI
jgi:peptide/nickel transport system ATP-binding protein